MLTYVTVINLQPYSFTYWNLHTVLNYLPNLTHLSLPKTANDLTLSQLTRYSALRSLKLVRNENITTHSLQQLSSLEQLTTLSLKWMYQIEGRALKFLPAKLTHLNLNHWVKLRDEHLSFLPKTIQKLNLGSCCQITNKGISTLSKLPQITSLSLNRCELITDDCLPSLPRSLTELDISFCQRITGNNLHDLPKNLTKLEFGHNDIYDITFLDLFLLENLTTLNLHNSNFCHATPPTFPLQLKHLDLYSSTIKNDDLRTLPRGLKTLDISWTMISNQGIKYLSSLKHLSELIISPSHIDSEMFPKKCHITKIMQRKYR